MNKRTKALQIPKRVKLRVYERDNGCCIWCGEPGSPDAHYISRGQSGLGIEENVLTLCARCHHEYDQGTNRAAMRDYFRMYLSGHYDDWNEENLIYRKENQK